MIQLNYYPNPLIAPNTKNIFLLFDTLHTFISTISPKRQVLFLSHTSPSPFLHPSQIYHHLSSSTQSSPSPHINYFKIQSFLKQYEYKIPSSDIFQFLKEFGDQKGRCLGYHELFRLFVPHEKGVADAIENRREINPTEARVRRGEYKLERKVLDGLFGIMRDTIQYSVFVGKMRRSIDLKEFEEDFKGVGKRRLQEIMFYHDKKYRDEEVFELIWEEITRGIECQSRDEEEYQILRYLRGKS